MTTSAVWVDGMTRALDLDVAAGLGLKTSPPKHATGGSIYGCPACSATIRHSKTEGDSRNPRGAIGVRKNGRGWRCFQCDVSGSAIDLVAYVLHGHRFRDLRVDQKTTVREWCQRWLRLEPGQPYTPTRPPAAEPAEPLPSYAPVAEVADFWDRCGRVDQNEPASAYLLSRGLKPGHIGDLDLARVLPTSGSLPDWARRWQSSGHPLVIPLYDSSADMRSVLARSLDREARPKSLAPAGFQRAGLSMQCPFARYIVRTAAFPEWWPEHTALQVMIAEGEVDFLTLATEWSESAEYAPASIGVFAGSWTPELAARIPDRAVLQIGTHADKDGEKYARNIFATVKGRPIEVRRWNPGAAA